MPPAFELQLELQTICNVSNIPSAAVIQNWIKTTLQYMHPIQACIHPPIMSVTLRVVDEPEIQHLNNSYRKKNKPTNVLSFPDTLPVFIKTNLEAYPIGDIILCAPVVEQEALAQNKILMNHWAHMIVHSTLHLLGYDHEVETEAIEMESYEQAILNLLGLGLI
jgi:probable rRNA maturation factor